MDDIEARNGTAPSGGRAPDGDVTGPMSALGGRAAEGRERIRQVRRRVLTVQLARLALRGGTTDRASRDAAARAVRLTSRLEQEELAW